jgi:hypothetical protein
MIRLKSRAARVATALAALPAVPIFVAGRAAEWAEELSRDLCRAGAALPAPVRGG